MPPIGTAAMKLARALGPVGYHAGKVARSLCKAAHILTGPRVAPRLRPRRNRIVRNRR